ncbi:hypothetical protein RclHR1_00660007 [Rhizophagus clarus]|uniref:Kinase-like domain-containing protein n=1 Tax=Rhizophagus clarus TaxID=94130 RepID=A0A2Z6RYM7_9GLOM|nr:hypothetical protein RclHR1_00660007 [Rhizophagus clarus]GES73867.1 kinase-like domain-containing protein [Rhizophagus clarus]
MYDQEVIYTEGCTGIEQLNQLTNSSNCSNGNFKMAFFYNPPGDHQTYHITCEEVPMSFELICQLTNDTNDNDQAHNYVQSKNYVFYHSQLNTKKIYRVTCELASPQFLNKRFYNIYYNQQNEQQLQQQEVSPVYLKFHLKQLLTNFLTPKEIYEQNLHGSMMQDCPPPFRGASRDTQGHENISTLFSPNNDNIQQQDV